MEKNEIRKLVRETLSEIAMAIGGGGWDSNNDVAQFHGSPSGYGQFPYLYTDRPDMLPSVGDLKSQGTNEFEQFRRNNEVYEFPYESFKNGIEQEVETCKQQGKDIYLYDIARFVIDNLQKDKNFYSSANVNNNQGDNEEQEETNS
jgi:hypothetical protein